MEDVHESIGDLRGEVFLNLKSTRKHVDDPRHLGESDNLALRNIGNVRLPNERQEMMLAHRVKLDVLHEHNLARFRFEDRVVHNLIQALPVAGGQELESSCRATGRLEQAFPLRVFPDGIKNLMKRTLQTCDSRRAAPRDLANPTISGLEFSLVVVQDAPV